MEEWKEYKLGEVSDITKLAGFEFTKYVKYKPDGEIIAIRALNLRDGHLELKDVQRIEKETSNGLLRSKLYKGDIVLSYTGTIGACAIITENDKYHLAPNVCKITPYDSIEPFFLYYIIRSRAFQESLIGYAHGSTQPTIPMKTIREIPIRVCAKDRQQKIASILSSLDDKIELNRRINENLEAQAQALFKSWFVDFEPFRDGEFVESELGMIPKGWKVGKANEVFEINIGKTPPRKEPEWFTESNEDNVWVSIADMGSCGVFISDSSEYLTDEAIKRFNVQMVDKDSILLSFKLTIGRVAIADKILTTNEAIARFLLPDKSYREFLYLYLKQYKYENLGSTSSIATAVNSKTIKGMTLIIPQFEEIACFSKITKPLFEQIRMNLQESRCLATLRDTLLPRLMSGEIKVGDVTL